MGAFDPMIAAPRAWSTRMLVAFVMLALVATLPARAADRLSEYQIKAAFLYNLAKFVQWPASADPSDQLVVCVIGDDFFRGILHHLVRGKSVQAREIDVRGLRKSDDLLACDIAFVSAMEARHTTDILLRVQPAGVLTVGETPEFLRDGGHVRFYVENNRIRVEIDAAGTDQSGLKVNSQLLSLARR
jgi:hypothetical protein